MRSKVCQHLESAQTSKLIVNLRIRNADFVYEFLPVPDVSEMNIVVYFIDIEQMHEYTIKETICNKSCAHVAAHERCFRTVLERT